MRLSKYSQISGLGLLEAEIQVLSSLFGRISL